MQALWASVAMQKCLVVRRQLCLSLLPDYSCECGYEPSEVMPLAHRFCKVTPNYDAGLVGFGGSAEEFGDGPQAGSCRNHEHPEEALQQALQQEAV